MYICIKSLFFLGIDIQYGVKDADVYRMATMNVFFPLKLKYFFIPDFRAMFKVFFIGKIGDTEPDYMAELGKTFDIPGIEVGLYHYGFTESKR